MTLQEAKARMLRAITRATNEHGWPNTFAFGELSERVGMSPMLAGRVFEVVRADWESRHPSCVMFRTADGRVSIEVRP